MDPQSILEPPQIKPITTGLETVEGALKVSKFPKLRFPKFGNLSLRKKKIILSVFGAILVLFLLSLFLIVIPSLSLYRKGMELKEEALALKASVASQDINVVKRSLDKFEAKTQEFQSEYKKFSWTGGLPYIGAYWEDGQAALNASVHGMEAAKILIVTAEPYADIIGFTSNSTQAASPEDSANDRIEFIIETIDDILPQIDTISDKVSKAREEINKIDPERYPDEFRGVKVKEQIKQIIDLANQAADFAGSGKPLLESAPYLLGVDDERTYLILFQNDKELRPTGGFITAYSIVRVKNGKLSPVSSNDIYNLDSRYTPSVPAPKPIVDLIKGPYLISKNLRLRDMNWSPDFKESMDLFTREAKNAGIDRIDGIIAVDTHVVVNILDVIGEIGVSGFGNFSTKTDERCNCPQVIYELESFADVEGPVVWSQDEPGKIIFAPANYENRKEIVGPLMNSIIGNALGQPKEKLPDLFAAAWESVTEKHVLLYLFDEKVQMGAEGFNIAGKIKDFEGDYLHINDANLGGRKSNLYVTQEVAQDYDVRGGEIVKTVTLTYKNPQDYDGWLNSVLPNWTRIYVPKGSELISVEGFEMEGEVYEELGKTVFSGGFELRPQGVKKITVKYKLPFKAGDNLTLLVQKQPGTDAPLHSISVGGKLKEELFLKTDKEFKLSL